MECFSHLYDIYQVLSCKFSYSGDVGERCNGGDASSSGDMPKCDCSWDALALLDKGQEEQSEEEDQEPFANTCH